MNKKNLVQLSKGINILQIDKDSIMTYFIPPYVIKNTTVTVTDVSTFKSTLFFCNEEQELNTVK